MTENTTPARATLTEDEISALVGDDIAWWVGNEFLSREDLLGKICWWVTRAVAAREAAREAAVRAQIKADILAVANDPDRKRPLKDDAEFPTDRATDFEWAARIAGGEQA